MYCRMKTIRFEVPYKHLLGCGFLEPGNKSEHREWAAGFTTQVLLVQIFSLLRYAGTSSRSARLCDAFVVINRESLHPSFGTGSML